MMKMAAAHVPDEIIEALDRIAERQGVERTKVIRWALIDYIKRDGTTDIPIEQDDVHNQVAA